MSKQIQYPTPEWIDEYMDKHANDNNGEGVSMEDAEQAWWYKQVDLGNPTPDDLTPEQEKASKKARDSKTHKKVERKPRERKPNEEKRSLIQQVAENLVGTVEDVAIANPEREITFTIGSNHYSLTLIAHRPPKE